MPVLLTPPVLQFFDSNGAPLAGGKLYSYIAGTLVPKATYLDEEGTTAATNPVILDSAGRTVLFITGSYDFTLTDANDVVIRTVENVTSFSAVGATSPSYFQSFSGNGATTSFTLSQDLGTDEKTIMVFVDAGAGKGYDIQNPSAYTLNGTSLTFAVAPASGTNNIYVFAPSTFLGAAASYAEAAQDSANAAGVSETNAASSASAASTSASNASTFATNSSNSASSAATSASTATTQASNASSSASAAATSASNALTSETNAQSYALAAAGTRFGTSTTSNTIGTGTKTFTTQSGLSLLSGAFVVISDSSNAANYMHGQVTSYSSTTLQINSLDTGGSGTIASWNISPSGPQGSAGAGSGTVNSGTGGQITYYAANGTTVSGNANLTISTGAVTVGVAGSVQGSLKLAGSASGTTTIAAPAAGTGTMTLQAGSDTIVGRATTDTLTNKTYDTAGTGNTFKINGTTINAISGNTSKVATTSGALTSTHVAVFDAIGNIVDGGSFPTGGVQTVKSQVFTSSGTYTPSTGMLYCIVECLGGGGGGGGASGQSIGTPGGAGEYAKALFSASDIGASKTVTIGAAGTAGTSGGVNGGNGGTTSLGALISCNGGTGGLSLQDTNNLFAYAGGAGGTGGTTSTGGIVRVNGQPGGYSLSLSTSGSDANKSASGLGGATVYGSPGTGLATGAATNASSGYGAGGNGARGNASRNGAAGTAGIVIITEFCSQ